MAVVQNLSFTGAVILLLGLINLAGLVLAGIDKYKAKKRKWRIPEKSFFVISLLGGSFGTFTGLLLFRHKTRHLSFMFGIPLILCVEIVAAYFLLRS